MIEGMVPVGHVILKWLLAMPVRFLVFRIEVRGRENIPDVGGVIVVANHISNLDPGVIGTTVDRRIRFMAKRELFRPPFGVLFRLYGAFLVRRLEADIGALRKAEKIVRSGDLLGMFPEGTRSRGGQLTEAHPGTALIALRTGAPVVPAAIAGTDEVEWPLGIFRRPRLRVVYGEPFFLERPARINSASVQEATIDIMKRVADLLPAERRGVYGGDAKPSASPVGAPNGSEALEARAPRS
ncbi:MAG: 1-acyl-sn-glycerol-3-phosphate acyltransferase [Dehalococcoidia bacterium]|nr:1-acyl-sn-glycerol-3-phosphate acyltransferase [Dehalococcoidia bacterium]